MDLGVRWLFKKKYETELKYISTKCIFFNDYVDYIFGPLHLHITVILPRLNNPPFLPGTWYLHHPPPFTSKKSAINWRNASFCSAIDIMLGSTWPSNITIIAGWRTWLQSSPRCLRYLLSLSSNKYKEIQSIFLCFVSQKNLSCGWMRINSLIEFIAYFSPPDSSGNKAT